MLVADNDDVGFAASVGGGGFAGVGGNLSLQLQVTNADSISDLAGPVTNTGGSFNIVAVIPGLPSLNPSFGAEGVVAPDYEGVNLQAGVSVLAPWIPFYEFHFFLEYNWLWLP